MERQTPSEIIKNQKFFRAAAGITLAGVALTSVPRMHLGSEEHTLKPSVASQLENPRELNRSSNLEQNQGQIQKAIENHIVNNLTEEVEKDSNTDKTELKENIRNIVDSLKKEKIATPRVIAYAIATTGRETAHTFKPIREFDGEQNAEQYGYDGGEDYYGRGYIQLTHKRNYKKIDRALHLHGELTNNPDLALQPNVAADILAAYFKNKGVAKKAEEDFVAARRPINGNDHAQSIANEANQYLDAIDQG